MRALAILVAAGLGLGLPVPGHAQSFSGAEQIAGGDLAAAEREIGEQRRVFPNDPDLLINLAHIYARTDRLAEARRLYRVVLDRPDEDLVLADGRSAPAHALASEGLRRTTTQVVATR